MDAAIPWLTLVGTLAAGAAAIFAWVQAHEAVNARKDASESAATATAMLAEQRRLADAAEAANELTKARQAPRVDWRVTPVKQFAYRLVNVGNATAYDARVVEEFGGLILEEKSPRHIAPGGSLGVHAWRGMSGHTPAGGKLVYHRRVDDSEVGEEFEFTL